MHRALSLITFLVAFSTYFLTGSPSITFGFPSELAVSVLLGPDATTSVPVWSWLGSIITAIIPVDPGGVLVLVTALFAGCTSVMIYLIGADLSGRAILQNRAEVDDEDAIPQEDVLDVGLWGSFLGALAFTWFDSVWSQAIVISNRPVGTFLALFAFWATLKWCRIDRNGERRVRWAVLAGLALGLAAGIDRLALIALPAIALLVWNRRVVPATGDANRLIAALGLAAGGFILLWFAIGAESPLILAALIFAGSLAALSSRSLRPVALSIAAGSGLILVGLATMQLALTSGQTTDRILDTGALSISNALQQEIRAEEALFNPTDSSMSAPSSFRYLFGHHGTRYLLWNLAGRTSNEPGASSFLISPNHAESSRVEALKHPDDPWPVSFYLLPLLLFLVGIALHFRFDWRGAMPLLAMALLFGPLLSFSMPDRIGTTVDIDSVYVYALAPIAIWIGIAASLGADAAAGWARKVRQSDERGRTFGFGVMVVCFCAVPFNLLWHGLDTHDRSDNYLVFDLARNLVVGADSNAIVLVDRRLVSPARYAQAVRNGRHDILIRQYPEWERARTDQAVHSDSVQQISWVHQVDTTGRTDTVRWPSVLDGPDSLRQPTAPDLRLLHGFVRASKEQNRPLNVAVTISPDYWHGLDRFFRMNGLLFQVRTDTSGQYRYRVNGFAINGEGMGELLDAARRPSGTSYVFRSMSRRNVTYSPIERRFILIYRRLFVNLAAYHLKSGDGPSQAASVLDDMGQFIPSDIHPPAYWFSAAVADLYSDAGEEKKAHRYAEMAIAAADRLGKEWRSDPIARRYNPYQITARMLALLGRHDDAIRRYEELQQEGPADATVRGLIEELRVRKHLDRGDTAAAIRELTDIIKEYGDPDEGAYETNLGAWRELLEELEQ